MTKKLIVISLIILLEILILYYVKRTSESVRDISTRLDQWEVVE